MWTPKVLPDHSEKGRQRSPTGCDRSRPIVCAHLMSITSLNRRKRRERRKAEWDGEREDPNAFSIWFPLRFLRFLLLKIPFRGPTDFSIPRMRESKYRRRWNRSFPASDVEDGCECNLFEIDLVRGPERRCARDKCYSTDRRACGRHGARSHPAPPNPLDVSLARNLPRHSPGPGLARKGEGKVWRKPNSS